MNEDNSLEARLTELLEKSIERKHFLAERAQELEKLAGATSVATLALSYQRQAFWSHAQANAYRDQIVDLERLLGR